MESAGRCRLAIAIVTLRSDFLSGKDCPVSDEKPISKKLCSLRKYCHGFRTGRLEKDYNLSSSPSIYTPLLELQTICAAQIASLADSPPRAAA
jgi:hypothetical protein